MTTKINSDTSDGLKITSDTSGILDIQSAGTTKMTVGTTIDIQGNELVLDADGDSSIHSSVDDQIDFKTGGTDRFEINASGNVEVLNGNFTIDKSSSPNLLFNVNGTEKGYVRQNANDLESNSASGNVLFKTGGTDRMTIDSSGNIDITTGVINVPSGDFKIQLNGENRYKTEPANGIHRFYTPDEGIFVFSNQTGTNTSLFKGHHSATDANGTNATTAFVVFGNGNVQNLNNSYGALSDLALKENISDSSSQWNDIKAVKVKKYSLKADNLDSANQIGVIAQDLESSGMNGLVETIDDVKSVKYSVLYMKAVKALQEAMTRIETLEAKVTALESE